MNINIVKYHHSIIIIIAHKLEKYWVHEAYHHFLHSFGKPHKYYFRMLVKYIYKCNSFIIILNHNSDQ